MILEVNYRLGKVGSTGEMLMFKMPVAWDLCAVIGFSFLG